VVHPTHILMHPGVHRAHRLKSDRLGVNDTCKHVSSQITRGVFVYGEIAMHTSDECINTVLKLRRNENNMVEKINKKQFSLYKLKYN